jgi:hypothetical protein
MLQSAMGRAERSIRNGRSPVIVLVLGGKSSTFCPYVFKHVLSNLEESSDLRVYVVTLGDISPVVAYLAKKISLYARTPVFRCRTIDRLPAVFRVLRTWLDDFRTASWVGPPFRFQKQRKLCDCTQNKKTCKCRCKNGNTHCGCPYFPYY